MKTYIFLFLSVFMSLFIKAQPSSQSLGNLKSFSRQSNGIHIQTTYGVAEIIIYTPEIVRIRIDKKELQSDFSYAVIAQPLPTNFTIRETEGTIMLTTDSLRLDISTNPVRFKFRTKNGLLLNEDDSFGTNWVGEEVTTYKKLQADEKFIGLGEKTGNMNRRGEGYTNWNSDVPGYTTSQDPLYSTFPFYIGIHQEVVYGIFFDNTHKSYFNFGASNDRFSSFGADAGEMNYYFIGGTNIPKIIDNYTWLTGKMPMPPLWGIGNQQSRWSYFPDKEVLKIASTFRDKAIPLDVLYLDIHYMDNYKVFTWHPQRFPSPKNTINQLKNSGIHTALIIDPGIKVEEGYSAYESGIKKNIFLKYPDGTNYTAQVWPGWCHFPDFSKPETRLWWGENFASLTNYGVDGFWNDMNEIASWGAGKTPSLVEFFWEGKTAPYSEGKNVYGLLMARSSYESSRQLLHKRPLILTRAAYAGAQRYTAIWTGDNVASDEHMMLGCRMVNSLGITGMAFSGVDVGGFMGNASKELFARWISIGAFTPFLRVHKHYDYNASEPWSYGSDVENIARNYISLRYKLLPYLYASFYETHKNGIPINRNLVIENTFDEKCWYWIYQHQYMFGKSLMVAPVESSKSSCKVYLPEGNWYDFISGETYLGKQEITVDCPIDKLPIFVKGSSFIPMQKATLNTSESAGDTLYLHIYYGNTYNYFDYYEDDGISFENENGSYLLSRFVFDAQNQQITIPSFASSTFKQYNAKFKTIIPVLHGFESVANTIKINGKKTSFTCSTIDILNIQKQGTPEWLNSRAYNQNVIILIGVTSAKDTIITW